MGNAIPAAPVILVERGANKRKVDRFIRPSQAPARSSIPKARRITLTADQAHCICERFQTCAAWLIDTGGCENEACSWPHVATESLIETPLSNQLLDVPLDAAQQSRVWGAYLTRKDIRQI